jgi:phage pi2 protein 07
MELFHQSGHLQKQLNVQNGNIWYYNQQFVRKQLISHIPEHFLQDIFFLI